MDSTTQLPMARIYLPNQPWQADNHPMPEDQFQLTPPDPEPKKKTIRKRKPKPKVPAWLVWARSIGAVSVLGGGVGLMQPQYFWWGVGFVYAGVLLLVVDLWYEPQLKRRFKFIGEGILAVVIVLFSWKAVFISAPLNIATLATTIEYSSGTKIADIPWRPMYT